MKTTLSPFRNMNAFMVTFKFTGRELLQASSNKPQSLKILDEKGNENYCLVNASTTTADTVGASFPFAGHDEDQATKPVRVLFQIEGNTEDVVKLNAARVMTNLQVIEDQIIKAAKEVQKTIDSIKFDDEGAE